MHQTIKSEIAVHVKEVISEMNFSQQLDYILKTTNKLAKETNGRVDALEALVNKDFLVELMTDKKWCELVGIPYGEVADYSTAIRAGIVKYYYEVNKNGI